MATNTLLQRLDAAAETTGSSDGASNRRQVESFRASAAITAGHVVQFDDGKTGADRALYVKQATVVASGNALAIGVALTGAAAAGDVVQVIVAGYAENVLCDAGVNAGEALGAALNTAGEVAGSSGTTRPIFGSALEAEGGSGTVDMIVSKQF